MCGCWFLGLTKRIFWEWSWSKKGHLSFYNQKIIINNCYLPMALFCMRHLRLNMDWMLWSKLHLINTQAIVRYNYVARWERILLLTHSYSYSYTIGPKNLYTSFITFDFIQNGKHFIPIPIRYEYKQSSSCRWYTSTNIL